MPEAVENIFALFEIDRVNAVAVRADDLRMSFQSTGERHRRCTARRAVKKNLRVIEIAFFVVHHQNIKQKEFGNSSNSFIVY